MLNGSRSDCVAERPDLAIFLRQVGQRHGDQLRRMAWYRCSGREGNVREGGQGLHFRQQPGQRPWASSGPGLIFRISRILLPEP